MNNKYACYIAVLLGIFLSMVSCSATKQHTLNALEPATVDLSNTITKIGVINESAVSNKSDYKTRLEQILSAKDHQLEKDGIDAAISGLFNELTNDQRFDTVQLIHAELNNSKGLGFSTESFSWDAIKEICETNGVDAIFSLAYYEADTRMSLKKKKIEEQNMLRQYEKVQGHEITLETLIENGWRIYDPYHEQIIDELVFNEHITSKGKGTNPVEALDDISDRWNTVVDHSKLAGSSYGLRLLPQEQELIREYYVRGSDKLVEAKNLATSESWEAAAALWEQEVQHTNPKIKAKACYNMAFYNEMGGNYQVALDWIEKAVQLDNGKSMIGYKKVLENRIAESKIVLRQLKRSNLSASVDME